MSTLNTTVCVKQWQILVMLAMTGFATGAMLVKLTTALGF